MNEAGGAAVFVETASAASLGAWLEERLRDPTASSECDVVVPAVAYDMGMRTRHELRRQLALDLPRSAVTVGKHGGATVERVLRSAANPRFCTQAALAPPLGWLIEHGFVAHELGESVMRVHVHDDGSVTSTKTLGLTTLAAAPVSCGSIQITVQAFDRHVVVGLVADSGVRCNRVHLSPLAALGGST